MKRTDGIFALATCLLSLAASSAIAADGIDQLTTRLPQGANAIIAADVGYLRASPQAGQMRWVARGAESGATALLPSIPGIKHLCLGAHLDFDSMRPDWQLALLEVAPAPSIDQLAQAMRGYTDTIGGAPAAWSPAGACYLGLDPQTLVSTQPGDRQLIARWIENVRSPAGNRSSPYLRTAAQALNEQTPIVLAVDLRDAFALPAVIAWLRVGCDDAVAKAMTDPAATAQILSTVRGITIKVAVGSATTAVATFDFSGETTPLAPVAKPLCLELMSDHGLAIPDIGQWTFSTGGRTVTAQGPLSDQGLRQLLSVLHAPSPQVTPAAAQPSAAGEAQPSTSMAAASAQYFNQVGLVLNGINPGTSLGQQSGWLWRDAKRIDELPAVNVDPEMMRWGASVSANLRQAASILDAGQQRVTAGAQSAQAPVGSYTSGMYDTSGGQRDAQYRAALENYRRQNQQAAAQIRAQVMQDANKPLQAALDSRGEIRATMAGRYGAAFQSS
jgi:hypothetical protein